MAVALKLNAARETALTVRIVYQSTEPLGSSSASDAHRSQGEEAWKPVKCLVDDAYRAHRDVGQITLCDD